MIKISECDHKKEYDMKKEFLPEFDPFAKKTDKIYNITSILSTEEFDLIDIKSF
jgi:hypothetical protein